MSIGKAGTKTAQAGPPEEEGEAKVPQQPADLMAASPPPPQETMKSIIQLPAATRAQTDTTPFPVNVDAKCLSGEGGRFHFMWDKASVREPLSGGLKLLIHFIFVQPHHDEVVNIGNVNGSLFQVGWCHPIFESPPAH